MLDYRLIAGCGLAAAAAFLARSEYERKALSLEEVSVETEQDHQGLDFCIPVGSS